MSSHTEEIICPYCGNEQATSNYESRGSERGETNYCFMCGWGEHIQADDCNNECDAEYVHIPRQHVIDLAKKILPIYRELDYEDDEDLIEDLFMSGWFEQFSSEKNYHAIIDILFTDRFSARKYFTPS